MTQLELFITPKPKLTQKDMILSHLKRRGSISALEGLHLYRINRLAARIEELRRAGHSIFTDMRTDVTGKRYARYKLV